MPDAVTFSAAVRQWLAHAAGQHGNGRFVALLAGPAHADPGRITACVALPWQAGAGDAFTVDPAAFARTEHTLRLDGLACRGFAHGHGDGHAAPSLADLLALWRDCVQVIGARGDDGPELRAYWLPSAGGCWPLPWRLAAEEP